MAAGRNFDTKPRRCSQPHAMIPPRTKLSISSKLAESMKVVTYTVSHTDGAGVVDDSTHCSIAVPRLGLAQPEAAKSAEKRRGNRRGNPLCPLSQMRSCRSMREHVVRSNHQRTRRNVRMRISSYRQTMFIRAAGLRALRFRDGYTR